MIKEGHKNIVWQHLSYDQPNAQYMKDRRFVDSVDHFVYVSHWQFNRFRERFAIPEYKSTVIKNAVDDHTGSYGRNHFVNTGNDVVRIMYTSTPWRGLSILVRAIEILNNLRDDFECIIYSSTKIYGKQFEKIEGDKFEPLFEKCRQTNNMDYRGYASNEDVRKWLRKSHILAYPSIFEETSCLSAIEALHAGCKVVTTNYGALTETCGDFADYVEFEPNQEALAQRFAVALSKAIDSIHLEDHDYHNQRRHYERHWTWNSRIYEWFEFLSKIKEK